METLEIQMRAGRYMQPVIMKIKGDQVSFAFDYSAALITAVKSMGMTWQGYKTKEKIWAGTWTQRAQFRFEYLTNSSNPFLRYDSDLPKYEGPRKDELREHQADGVMHMLTRKQCIIGGQPGVGKSLMAITAMEELEFLTDSLAWYVGPKSAKKSFELECLKWNARVVPAMFTYPGLVNYLKTYSGPAPMFFIIDESHKVKTPITNQAKACQYVADASRKEWGDNSYVILMSGTPSPKNPADWWNQAEIARPGYLLEGNRKLLETRLSFGEYVDNPYGGGYFSISSWKDDEAKCATCGKAHTGIGYDPKTNEPHNFSKSVNEVSKLYKRLKGLTSIYLKKDCMELPEKIFETIRVKPSADTLRVFRTIKETSTRAITALNYCRQLSDGFRYIDIEVGKEPCKLCENGQVIISDTETGDCRKCDGTSMAPVYKRESEEVPCPKIGVVEGLLDKHEEEGRFILWAAYEGSIHRLVKLALSLDWYVLQVDGKGFQGHDPKGGHVDSDMLLKELDAYHPNTLDKVCFVGHPESGGTGLTMTAAQAMAFYSNDFKSDSRQQAMDRFHRFGALGCLIYDIIHLPTDQLIIDNLDKKLELQNMTMGQINASTQVLER